MGGAWRALGDRRRFASGARRATAAAAEAATAAAAAPPTVAACGRRRKRWRRRRSGSGDGSVGGGASGVDDAMAAAAAVAGARRQQRRRNAPPLKFYSASSGLGVAPSFNIILSKRRADSVISQFGLKSVRNTAGLGAGLSRFKMLQFHVGANIRQGPHRFSAGLRSNLSRIKIS